MTIKTTLAYGRNFHFYQEALNNNYIYLELEDIPYDAGYRRIMIALPIDIWETIRGLGAARLELVNVEDAELIKVVTGRVDERIAQYKKAASVSLEEAESMRFDNVEMFGTADQDREQQITRGIEYYKVERERQRGVAARIAQHKIIEIDSDYSNSQEP